DVYAISNSGLVVPDHPAAKGEIVLQNQKSSNGLLNFWIELKRRKVVRVISVYAAASFVMLELASIVEEPLGLPDWTLEMLIVLLSIGFVLTSILSWVYDITPDGIEVTQPLKPDDPLHWSGKQNTATDRLSVRPHDASWFVRNKIFKRYLFPLLVFAVLFVIYQFRDDIFGNGEKENKVARFHTESATGILNNSGNLEVAKTELDLALEADPTYASALNMYAMIHLAEEDTAVAKQKLYLALDSDPAFSMAFTNLAAIAFWEDSVELALSYTIKAVECDPSNNLAACNMAVQSEKRGFHAQALEWYQKAISMDSSFTDAYSALGALYNDLNRPIDAILVLQKSLRISPLSEQNYRIYKNLGESHFLLKEYDKALAYLDQSKTENPDYPETEKCFARLYEARGEADQSIQHWKNYLELETDSTSLREARSHLDSLRANGPS
ncbi:MAG: hypothetical protein KAS29_09180, partial [Bacteroidales bacterium]|nr:hypothetical protein [Bacteroidales bacterium]